MTNCIEIENVWHILKYHETGFRTKCGKRLNTIAGWTGRENLSDSEDFCEECFPKIVTISAKVVDITD